MRRINSGITCDVKYLNLKISRNNSGEIILQEIMFGETRGFKGMGETMRGMGGRLYKDEGVFG